jgi:hypothetical protein
MDMSKKYMEIIDLSKDYIACMARHKRGYPNLGYAKETWVD